MPSPDAVAAVDVTLRRGAQSARSARWCASWQAHVIAANTLVISLTKGIEPGGFQPDEPNSGLEEIAR